MTFSVPALGQTTEELQEKLQDFFFYLSFHSDIEVIRLELTYTPGFTEYKDPNRDSKKTITGTISKHKNLNPVSAGNRVVILFSTSDPKKKKKISFKWSVDYRLEDLARALVDFEKLKAEFKPFFSDTTEQEEIGQQREQISVLILKMNRITVTIRLIRYNNFIHTLSLEYRDQWKIEAVDIMKVKN
jgi:hypothetical protein